MQTLSPERLRTLQALARRLAQAWRTAGEIDGIRPGERPLNRAEAYAVQDMMAEALVEPVTGWKVGATSPKMRELDGHDDVIPGRMFAATTFLGADHRLPIARFPGARAETEFAFRLRADMAPREVPWSTSELAPLVTLHPAVEIIGNRYPKGPAAAKVGTLETIADNGGGIGFVFGDPVTEWQSIDFRNHHISLRVDDGPEAENFLGEMRCLPIQAVTELLGQLARRGIGMKAGDFISTGAASVPQALAAGSRVAADFGAIGRIDLRFE